jgi:hypothetical protein
MTETTKSREKVRWGRTDSEARQMVKTNKQKKARGEKPWALGTERVQRTSKSTESSNTSRGQVLRNPTPKIRQL